MVVEKGNSFYSFDGKLYKSDIIRSCIRPKVKAVGKLVAKHVKSYGSKVSVNEVPHIRFLLEEPNPYMSGQMLQEKITTQLALNNNAFILIVRDELGVICQLYPVPAEHVEAIYINKELHYKFLFTNGKSLTTKYTEVIHIREDFNDNDIFGESPARALFDMLNVVSTIDQGIINAIKNSAVIKWLLKFETAIRPEDMEKQAELFAEKFLSTESKTHGVAATDAKADAQRIEPKDYVPNALQMDRVTKRIYAFFNTNEKIVHSLYNENEWNSYYESVIEPLALQLSNEFTRMFFSRKERSEGNRIYFEASNLQCASINTKLNLVQMVDRGALTPNEWREVFNLPPVDGGDVPIRRLDTDTVEKTEEYEEYS
ncbi:MAG: phage portal protein [Eubacteriales bacterium]|nr:phage portal protein [Eubacteriales bacterium]